MAGKNPKTIRHISFEWDWILPAKNRLRFIRSKLRHKINNVKQIGINFKRMPYFWRIQSLWLILFSSLGFNSNLNLSFHFQRKLQVFCSIICKIANFCHAFWSVAEMQWSNFGTKPSRKTKCSSTAIMKLYAYGTLWNRVKCFTTNYSKSMAENRDNNNIGLILW